jgi:hypothetical protein
MLRVVLLCTVGNPPVHPQPVLLLYIHCLFTSRTSTASSSPVHPNPVHLPYIQSLFTSRTSKACSPPVHPQPAILSPQKEAVHMLEITEIPTICLQTPLSTSASPKRLSLVKCIPSLINATNIHVNRMFRR